MRRFGILVTLFLFSIVSACALPIMVDDFEGARQLSLDGVAIQQGSHAEIAAETPYAGHGCAVMHYTFAQLPGLQYLEIPESLTAKSPVSSVSLAVRGDASNCPLKIRICDASGEYHQYDVINVDFSGWKVLTIPIGQKPGNATWGGDGNRRLDYPITVHSILLEHPAAQLLPAKGTVAFDNLTIETTGQPEDFLDVRMAAATPYGYFWGKKNPPKARVQLSGKHWVGTQQLDVPVTMQILDYRNTPVCASWRTTVKVKSGSDVSYDIPIPVTRFGVYTVMVQAGTSTTPCHIGWLNAPAPTWAEGPFGVQAHFGSGPQKYGDLTGMVQIIKNMGASWVRDEIFWSSAESTKGQISFPAFADSYMKALHDNGIQPHVELDFTNKFYDNGKAPCTDEGRTAFLRYVTAMMQRYGNTSHTWEVWNEPNLSGFWSPSPNTDDYTRLLQAVYPTIKKALPHDTVVGVSSSGIDFPFIKKVLQSGGATSMDAMSVHPYIYPRSPDEANLLDQLAQARLMLDENGAKHAKLWITEFGYPTHIGASGVSPARSAAYMVQYYTQALSLPYVERVFYYDIRDDGTNPKYNENNFGLVAFDGSPKAGYAAYNTMARMLYQKHYAATLAVGNTARCYEYTGAKGKVAVCWSTSGATTLSFASTSAVTLMDLMGNEQQLVPQRGVVTITALEDPVFITGYTSLKPVPAVVSLPKSLLCERGESVTVGIQTANGVAVPSWTPNVPQGWQATALGAGKFRLTSPREYPTGEYPISFTAKGMSIAVMVALRDSVTLSSVQIDAPDRLHATVANPFAKPHTVVLHAECPVRSLPDHRLLIPAQTTQRIDIPLPAETEKGWITLPITVSVTSDTTTQQSSSLPTPQDEQHVIAGITPAYAVRDIHLDGNLSEWQALKPCLLNQPYQAVNGASTTWWKGEQDLSARCWVGWDREKFYLAADVLDDRHFQPYTASNLWNGDDIQLAFGVGTTRYEFDMGITDANQVLSSGGPNTALQVAITRDGTHTRYEASIPWKSLGVNDPTAQPVRFALLCNDNDGQGRKGWMEWFEGIGNSKNTSLYAPLLFLK
ncbi:MAG TPA: sugar-binding protein [Armatimonadota bacterium]|nr:sugar-binding protein [Armatimonadota bacterium]